MTNKHIGVAALVCLVASVIPFWLWKDYIITGPSVRVLVWMVVALFGLALVLGFAYGCQELFRVTRNWLGRVFDVVFLLGAAAVMAVYACLAMNFVGQ